MNELTIEEQTQGREEFEDLQALDYLRATLEGALMATQHLRKSLSDKNLNLVILRDERDEYRRKWRECLDVLREMQAGWEKNEDVPEDKTV